MNLFTCDAPVNTTHNTIKRYGVSYKGSKNKICNELSDIFPKRKHFYDLFCGGCSVTHYLMSERKYDEFTINDIEIKPISLFINSAKGKYDNEKRWISRIRFFELKDDPYVNLCWSFGNNNTDYIYGEYLEMWKQALHYARVQNDFSLFKSMGIDTDASNTDIISNEDTYRKKYVEWCLKNDYPVREKSLNNLYRLQSYERLNQLKSLSGLDVSRLRVFNTDYENIHIESDSVIYCDIPYENTRGYSENQVNDFDYERFYAWCERQKEPLFISSYDMPRDKFVCIKEIDKQVVFKTSHITTERVFVPKHQSNGITLRGNNLLF